MTEQESQQYDYERGTPPPSEEPRFALCTYYGQSHRKAFDERRVASPCGEADKSFICRCKVAIPPNHSNLPWNEQLAFLRLHPDQPYDEFFCGCLGWD